MKQVNIYEAKASLSALVNAAEAGEDVIIARKGKPVARLVAVEVEPPKRRVFGQWAHLEWRYRDGTLHPAGEPVVIPDLTEEEIAEWYDAPITTDGSHER